MRSQDGHELKYAKQNNAKNSLNKNKAANMGKLEKLHQTLTKLAVFQGQGAINNFYIQHSA